MRTLNLGAHELAQNSANRAHPWSDPRFPDVNLCQYERTKKLVSQYRSQIVIYAHYSLCDSAMTKS